jgi:ribonucleoside-diphosphate reductase beta chain/ribonucleoside-diphosphate reductase subunit M2
MGYKPLYFAENPFPFMNKMLLNDVSKTNFFESRPTQYQNLVKSFIIGTSY